MLRTPEPFSGQHSWPYVSSDESAESQQRSDYMACIGSGPPHFTEIMQRSLLYLGCSNITTRRCTFST